jgi:26S proteasome regulatory subunit T3
MLAQQTLPAAADSFDYRYINLQEEYIKDEQRNLKRELVRAQEEIKRIQSVPLVIGQFMEAIDQK